MRSLGLGFVVCGAMGCVVGGTEGVHEFGSASALTVELGNGEVLIVSSPDESLRVHYDGGGIGRAARPEIEQDSSGAVWVDGGGPLGGGELEIEVPAGIPVTAEVDSGEITIELSSPANIDACVGAGELSIGVPAGSYNLQVQAGAGEVDLGLVNDPSAEYSIRACAGAGEIELYVFDGVSREDD
jgi:hypothetical protein